MEPMTLDELLELRKRIISGEKPSEEELKRAAATLRDNRIAAAKSKTPRAAKRSQTVEDIIGIL